MELKEVAWRLIDSGLGSAAWNMAVDEAIMQGHAAGGDGSNAGVPPTLRFYGWEPAAVSVGYFQPLAAEVDLDACRRLGYGYVRRPTGGRAIFHHIELTYSVVIRSELLPGSVLDTYRFLARGLLAGLHRLGVPAEIAVGEPDPRSGLGPEAGTDGTGGTVGTGGPGGPGSGAAVNPTISACFDTPSAYELVVGGRKVIGSAQTRHQETILQHGTILLDLDHELLFTLLKVEPSRRRAAVRHLQTRAVGLRELLGRPVSRAEAGQAMAAGFAEALGLTLQTGELTARETVQATALMQEKYGNDRWNLRK